MAGRPLREMLFTLEDSAILMDYIGNEATPAPLLLGAEDRVHGDLSPYNILYWDEQITIIDLPQMVDPRFNLRFPVVLPQGFLIPLSLIGEGRGEVK